MGSQGIHSACDTIIVLKKPDGDLRGTLTVKGRDIEERRLDVLFDRDLCTWRIIGEGSVTRPEPRAQAEILTLLQDAGPDGMKTGEIAKALGKQSSATNNLLNALLERGKIDNITRGTWVISHIHNSSQVKNNENVKFTYSHPLRESENVNLRERANSVNSAPTCPAGELEIY